MRPWHAQNLGAVRFSHSRRPHLTSFNQAITTTTSTPQQNTRIAHRGLRVVRSVSPPPYSPKAAFHALSYSICTEHQLTRTSTDTFSTAIMGISRDTRHKRSASGAKRAYYRKKRYYPPNLTSQPVSNNYCVEHSRKGVNQPTLVSEASASISSVSVAETPSIALSVLTPATSAGAQKVSPAKPVSSS